MPVGPNQAITMAHLLTVVPVVMLLFGLVDGDCTSDLNSCRKKMPTTQPKPSEMAKYCGTVMEAVACMEGLTDKCPDVDMSQVAQMKQVCTGFGMVIPETPTLTASNHASTLLTRTKLTLTCKTTSQGHVSYKFLINGRESPGSGPVHTFVTPNAGTSIFTCTATINGAKSAPSSGVTVKYVDKPRTPTLSVSTKTPSHEDDVTLTCTSQTRSVNKYEFFCNGTSLHRAGTTKTYTVKSSDPNNHNGDYTCKAYIDTVASDMSGKQALVWTGLVVTFTASPTSIEPLVTKNLTLICSLDDAPSSGKSQSSGSDLKLAVSITMTLNDVDIASIDVHHSAHTMGNSTGVASGQLINGEKGRLQMAWEYPSPDQSGHYACHVAGTSRRTNVTMVTKELSVGMKDINMRQLIAHVSNLQAAVDELKEKNDELKEKNAVLAAQVTKAKPDVFFSALLARRGTTNIKYGQTVIYDKVFVNKGNGYSASSGTFTCPVTGFYTFHVHGFTVNGNYFYLGLQHNGKTVVTVATAKNKGHTESGNTVTLKLNKFDVVKVVGTYADSKLYFYSSLYHAGNTFAGRLISIN